MGIHPRFRGVSSLHCESYLAANRPSAARMGMARKNDSTLVHAKSSSSPMTMVGSKGTRRGIAERANAMSQP